MAFVIICMVIIAATKPDTSADYENYYRMFVGYDDPKIELITEPTYIWISKIIHSLEGNFEVLLLVYALISIPLKIFALERLSSKEVLFLALPIYLSSFFMLHDCEQVRIAAAMAFIMYGYVCRVEKRHWLTWLSLWLAGVLFHYTTALAIIPLVLYGEKSFSLVYKLFLVGLVLSGVVIWVLKINLISIIPIPALEAKMLMYEMSSAKGDQLENIVLYHHMYLLRYITFFFALCYYDTLREHVKGLNIILISVAMGLFAWGGLSGFPVFSVRFSEMFLIPDAILFASVFYAIRPQWLGQVYPVVVGLVAFVLDGILVNQFGIR